MKDFGYKINADRQIDFDKNDFTLLYMLNREEPTFKLCIQCGSCSATCSASVFTPFNPRRIFLMIKRGMPENLKAEVARCMLCGKCTLACPRGVNTRNVMLNLKRNLL